MTWLIYYRLKTDDYETTLLLDDDDDDDDDDSNSTVYPTKQDPKMFNAGVIKRYQYIIILISVGIIGICVYYN